MATNGTTLSFHTVNGLKVGTFITEEMFEELKTFKLYPDDVWIVTYPKCGTTWTQQIVKLIRSRGERDDVKIHASIPWPEAIKFYPELNWDELQTQLPAPRVFKSHYPYDLLPCGPPHTTPCKYIFVARNPKDVAASFYFHTKIFYFPDITWDSFWSKYIAGDLEFGNYIDHLVGWWPHRNDKNVLFLKYEDMKKDLESTVSTIASFMGINLSNDIITKIANLTSFERMKEDNTANYSWREYYQKKGLPKFCRKGIIGDWKNFLSPEQSAEMDDICATRLEPLGLEFDYE